MNNKHLNAANSIVYEAPENSVFNYFGWPTVTRTANGELFVGCSGFRMHHVCPWGKNVLFKSEDDGKSWSSPLIVNDSPIDDRDAGLLALPGNELLLSYFSSDTRALFGANIPEEFKPVLAAWDDTTVQKFIGSFIRRRNAQGQWLPPTPVAVTSPHGPIQLRSKKLFYIGNAFGTKDSSGKLQFKMSRQTAELNILTGNPANLNWEYRGRLSSPAGVLFCEPHAIELANGDILVQIRRQPVNCVSAAEIECWITKTADNGVTWDEPKFLCQGGPPHLMRHSSGVLICTYGYRLEPYGQRIMFSHDDGVTWDTDWIIRDDGVNWDLGYPSTVEISDGKLLSVYYQATALKRAPAICASVWELPESAQK